MFGLCCLKYPRVTVDQLVPHFDLAVEVAAVALPLMKVVVELVRICQPKNVVVEVSM
jgi:hypothetical protein